eukprot:SAG22_NODE_243_length_14055_cov_3.073015_15_plen_123_part_00
MANPADENSTDADTDEWAVAPNNHKRRYFTALYWAFTTITTVGYGDIHAYNMWEMAVSILSMVIGVAVFNSVASTLNAELSAKAAARMDGERKMNTIAAFLGLRNVPASLRRHLLTPPLHHR